MVFVFRLSCSEKSYTGTCQVLRPPGADADEEPIEAPYPEGRRRPRGSAGMEVVLPPKAKGVAAKTPKQPQSRGSA